eukprot:2099954-Prymnesium_polylepis.1
MKSIWSLASESSSLKLSAATVAVRCRMLASACESTERNSSTSGPWYPACILIWPGSRTPISPK